MKNSHNINVIEITDLAPDYKYKLLSFVPVDTFCLKLYEALTSERGMSGGSSLACASSPEESASWPDHKSNPGENQRKKTLAECSFSQNAAIQVSPTTT